MRQITDIKLYEVSIVMHPLNPDCKIETVDGDEG